MWRLKSRVNPMCDTFVVSLSCTQSFNSSKLSATLWWPLRIVSPDFDNIFLVIKSYIFNLLMCRIKSGADPVCNTFVVSLSCIEPCQTVNYIMAASLNNFSWLWRHALDYKTMLQSSHVGAKEWRESSLLYFCTFNNTKLLTTLRCGGLFK